MDARSRFLAFAVGTTCLVVPDCTIKGCHSETAFNRRGICLLRTASTLRARADSSPALPPRNDKRSGSKNGRNEEGLELGEFRAFPWCTSSATTTLLAPCNQDLFAGRVLCGQFGFKFAGNERIRVLGTLDLQRFQEVAIPILLEYQVLSCAR